MLKKFLQSFCLIIDKIVMWIGKGASYLMPILAFIVVYEVIARYVFDAPTIWGYDMSLFLFGYVAALGGAFAQQRKAHINVDILYATVSPKVQKIFNVISYSLGIFFLVIIFKMGLIKFDEAMQYGYRRQSEWAPVMWHFWLMISVASAIFSLQLVRDMITDIYYIFTEEALIEKDIKND